jgi:ribosomal protein S18 acetylase RimI-like enzyme
MKLKHTSPFEGKPGIIARLLDQSYAELVKAEPELWEPEKMNWEETDRNVFQNPDTIGACTFLSLCGKDIAGFFSFDPRPQPAYGVIGHNCILPEYRNQGFGKQQVVEMLQKFRQIGIARARVSTNDHSFFLPAQRMYIACGFIEIEKVPWDRDPKQNIIRYETKIG